ncbi:DUF995 domain-containing protein [Leisingera caerulea]|uniref:DUF995 domain-containing protein n=1 Tax=Leisingera caerulea TaxID=506591 RepID=UPI00042455E7|nr:DUF995 domain-containing protein [Leisingera caerulea]
MKRSIVAAIAVTAIALTSPVFAGSKPKGAKPADPKQIAALYAGKTSHWTRGGYAYWGPGGEFLGVGKSGDSVGIGKWYVTTRGKLCHETQWYWLEKGERKSTDGKWCWDFVTAPDGVVWERFQEDKSNWYRHKPAKQHNGNTQRSKISSLRSKIGV